MRNWLRLMRPIKIRKVSVLGVAAGVHEEPDETGLCGLRSE
jgi:hypothetical protein